jgi:hypothetical protein
MRPLQMFDQFTRQAKGQIKTTHPCLGLLEPIGKRIKGVKPQQALQLHTTRSRMADSDHDGFAFRGAAAEVAADEIHARLMGR